MSYSSSYSHSLRDHSYTRGQFEKELSPLGYRYPSLSNKHDSHLWDLDNYVEDILNRSRAQTVARDSRIDDIVHQNRVSRAMSEIRDREYASDAYSSMRRAQSEVREPMSWYNTDLPVKHRATSEVPQDPHYRYLSIGTQNSTPWSTTGGYYYPRTCSERPKDYNWDNNLSRDYYRHWPDQDYYRYRPHYCSDQYSHHFPYKPKYYNWDYDLWSPGDYRNRRMDYRTSQKDYTLDDSLHQRNLGLRFGDYSYSGSSMWRRGGYDYYSLPSWHLARLGDPSWEFRSYRRLGRPADNGWWWRRPFGQNWRS